MKETHTIINDLFDIFCIVKYNSNKTARDKSNLFCRIDELV